MKKFMPAFLHFFIKTGRNIILISLSFAISITTAQATLLASIKPIGFISDAITAGVTETSILLPDGVSPHNYSLKPSDLAKLKSAHLIIWVGEDMEAFMPNVLKSIDKERQLELMALPQIKTLLRKGDSHHDNDNEHDHDHDHGKYDEHIWLSPEIAKIIGTAIHDKLIQLYPEKTAIIDENLNEFIANITEMEQIIAKKLIPVQNKGYFVFHDAYGYFESLFGLKNLGSFTINPAIQPGVKTVYAIQEELKSNHAVCIFKEPQFNPAVIDKLVNGTTVKVGELDPLGMAIPLSKDAYPKMLMHLTSQFLACLAR